jgi:hypothetical protein
MGANIFQLNSFTFKFAQIDTNFTQIVTNRLGLDTERGRGRGQQRQCALREAESRSMMAVRQ